MSASRHFRFPISRLEWTWRKLYSATLRKCGVNRHVVRAQGARFSVDTTDYIDQCIAFDGMWEAPQLEVLAELCKRKKIDCFIDVGANAGFYSIMFAMKKLKNVYTLQAWLLGIACVLVVVVIVYSAMH